MSVANLPGQFGHVDLDDLDLVSDAEAEELHSFESALAEMPRSEPPRSCPPEH